MSNVSYLRCFQRVLDMVPRRRAPADAGGGGSRPGAGRARIAALSRQYALDAWEREHRRRTRGGEGKLDVLDEPGGPAASAHQPRACRC